MSSASCIARNRQHSHPFANQKLRFHVRRDITSEPLVVWPFCAVSFQLHIVLVNDMSKHGFELCRCKESDEGKLGGKCYVNQAGIITFQGNCVYEKKTSERQCMDYKEQKQRDQPASTKCQTVNADLNHVFTCSAVFLQPSEGLEFLCVMEVVYITRRQSWIPSNTGAGSRPSSRWVALSATPTYVPLGSVMPLLNVIPSGFITTLCITTARASVSSYLKVNIEEHTTGQPVKPLRLSHVTVQLVHLVYGFLRPTFSRCNFGYLLTQSS